MTQEQVDQICLSMLLSASIIEDAMLNSGDGSHVECLADAHKNLENIKALFE